MSFIGLGINLNGNQRPTLGADLWPASPTTSTANSTTVSGGFSAMFGFVGG